jgi:hypothetical protein
MIKLLGGLIGLFNKAMEWWTARQQQQMGRTLERAEAAAVVADKVEKANEAITVDDPVRTERLRSRFDRSRRPADDPESH